MRSRDRGDFTTIKTEGAILPPDLLARVREGDGDLGGLRPEDYHLDAGEKLNERISRSWNRMLGAWAAFQARVTKLSADDPGTTPTRERWLLPLFEELGYGRLQTAKAIELNGKSYPISHEWGSAPIHLVGSNIAMDRRTAGVAGAARTSPHSLVQEFLNRSDDHLWAFLSNGRLLRILRDNASLTRQAYVEFDLEGMMEGEVYADFALLWLLCHQSRVEGERPEEFWLERWSQAAQEQGTRALDQLRGGVEEAIRTLGEGFLTHPANHALKERLREGDLEPQEYYRQLMRMVYRLIFLFVAEDRELLHDQFSDPNARARYREHYSMARLRRLAERRRGTRHPDLYRGMCLVMEKLGEENGCPELGLPGLGSFLWSEEAVSDLAECQLANRDLLDVIRSLAFTEENRIRRSVDYKNLGPEELGSVYESLLELQPEMNLDAPTFELKVVGGSERKTTGSFYTPTSLIQCLLDSALDPVVEEALKEDDPERALLNLKICDPACGSGHFLVAAAHRVARRLTSARTGDEEPSPEAQRTALREVIGRCIYGVDINPMAVELCKVNLWLEALDPGKPLTFLDDQILCGNSLLGTTPAMMEQGIPDEAFNPIEGDDRKFASSLKKQNKQERSGQMSMFAEFERAEQIHYALIQREALALAEAADDSVKSVREKGAKYKALLQSDAYLRSRLLADAWCATFVWRKRAEASEPITESTFRRMAQDPGDLSEAQRTEIERLAERYRFFHWHLAFPSVFWLPEASESELTGWSGGFDVVMGNPPWERVKLQEKEWFAGRNDEIAIAPNKAERERLICRLQEEDSGLYAAFLDAKRGAEAESHILRKSGCYPLCGRGDINTYTVFTELKRSLIASRGRVGCIVPTGIATDDTTRFFFQDLMDRGALVSLFDFENRKKLFPAVDSRMKFCLLTLTSPQRPARAADFVFFAQDVEDLREEKRHFNLTQEEIALLNPNTRTCPIFRSKKDAELTKAIYRRIPVLIKEGSTEENPLGIRFMTMFHMANDSRLFRMREQLETEGWKLEGNVFIKNSQLYVPLYEAKMINQFDHRAAHVVLSETAVIRQGQPLRLTNEQHQDPSNLPIPRYWVAQELVEERLADFPHSALLGFADVTSPTNERTMIATIIPQIGVGHTLPLALSSVSSPVYLFLLSNLNSFVFDYLGRQKLGGIHYTYFILKQLPVLSSEEAKQTPSWNSGVDDHGLIEWFTFRGLELVFTALDLTNFAHECGYDGPAFRWDETRRFLLRCELDAAFFHLYGVERDDVDYIMKSFPIVKRKDEEKYSEYRTKRVILEIYDEMQQAITTGEPYQTRLDPPPADPRVAHQENR